MSTPQFKETYLSARLGVPDENIIWVVSGESEAGDTSVFCVRRTPEEAKAFIEEQEVDIRLLSGLSPVVWEEHPCPPDRYDGTPVYVNNLPRWQCMLGLREIMTIEPFELP